jgi:hypothetical protein
VVSHCQSSGSSGEYSCTADGWWAPSVPSAARSAPSATPSASARVASDSCVAAAVYSGGETGEPGVGGVGGRGDGLTGELRTGGSWGGDATVAG